MKLSSLHLVVYCSFSRQEALTRGCYVPAKFTGCSSLEHELSQTGLASYVCLGLACITPSSLTMPTPTLLAEPSIPSTNIPYFALSEEGILHNTDATVFRTASRRLAPLNRPAPKPYCINLASLVGNSECEESKLAGVLTSSVCVLHMLNKLVIQGCKLQQSIYLSCSQS